MANLITKWNKCRCGKPTNPTTEECSCSYCDGYAARDGEIEALRAAIDAISTSDLGKALDVVEFYADPENYHAVSFLFDRPCGGFADDFDEDHGHHDYDRPMPGKLARTFLRSEGLMKKVEGDSMSIGEICKHNSPVSSCRVCELEADVRVLTASLNETESARDSAQDRGKRLYKDVADYAEKISKLQNEINASTCEKIRLANELLAKQEGVIDLRNALCGILYLADTARVACYLDIELPTKIVDASRRALEKTQ